MKKLFLPFILILTSLFISSCDKSDKPARGPEDEIIVVADSSEFEEMKIPLEQTFEKTIYTPQPENIFNLIRVSPGNFERYKSRKNIIIVAPLNSGSKTSEYIKAIIDSSLEANSRSDDDFIIRKYDFWRKNQLVTVLTAPTEQDLEFKILKHQDDLLYAYQKISDERLYSSLYSSRYEQKDVEGMLLHKYGWIIYVQADFKIAIDDSVDKFVWFRRSPNSDMERWIFVHWIENASPEYLNEDSIRTIRNRVTKKFYRTSDDSAYVVIAQDYFTNHEVNFKDRYAIFTQGLWELNIKGMGGPFVNYTFFDEKTNRIYMLDGAVYAPKYYKRNLIQQMDVTLQSFMTEAELSKDKKENLLEEAEDEGLINPQE